MKKLLLLLPLLTPLFTTGCHEFHDPRWDATDYTLLAVPFRDRRDVNGWYLWSKNGKAITAYFKEWVEKNVDSKLLDSTEARDFLERVEKWSETEEIRNHDWARLVQDVPADLVLVGEINSLTYQRPLEQGIYRGHCEWHYRIYRTADGRRVYYSGPRETTFPKQQEIEVPINPFEFERKKDGIRRGLLQLVGEEIGKDLYGYFED